MDWSKLKHVTEARFADGVRGRVRLWTTRYRYRLSGIHTEGRSWITIDGLEIVSMSRWDVHDIGLVPGCADHEAPRFAAGRFDTYDLQMACEAMLTVSVDDAFASANPILRGLAILDARFGRRRLRQIDGDAEPELVRALLAFRRSITACPEARR